MSLTQTQQKNPVVARVNRAECLAQIASPGWLDGVFRMLGDREPQLFVGNEFVATRSGTVAETIDPSSGRAFARYAIAGPDDVDHTVRVAHQAQPAWARLTIDERGLYLRRLADLIAENGPLLAAIDAIDAGLPVDRMLNDIDANLRVLRGWPGLASSLRGDVVEGIPGFHYTRYSPYGVVVRIVAFNHPVLLAVKGTLAALMAGNTVVLKPSDQTPMSALVLGELIREVFPPGVYNVVTGDGGTGSALVTHPLVRRIAFTGSAAVGRLIQQQAARDTVRHVSLELGGKNPMIVFPDVVVRDAAANAVFGMNLRANQGQSCGSTSRVFVHRDIYDEFLAELGTTLDGMRLGPAYQTDIDMGPMISAVAATRVNDYVRKGVAEGARLVTGGVEDPRVPEAGYFVAPTLFADVPAESTIAREEIFGPVIAVFPWDDYESVVAAANSVEYGLAASIWTNDLSTALATADRLEAGYIWVNDSTTHYWGAPFGGFKSSGVGREESIEELWGYLQLKSVHVKLG